MYLRILPQFIESYCRLNLLPNKGQDIGSRKLKITLFMQICINGNFTQTLMVFIWAIGMEATRPHRSTVLPDKRQQS